MHTDHTNVDVSVRVNGNAVATHSHEGKTFIEAKEGTQYHLHVKNNNPHRVKLVLSVDGVNIVSGKPASGDQEETGYILNAWETQTIKGYRLDDDSVAAFRFTKAEGGYAQAEQGLKGTTGVIGCKVWKEKVAAPAAQVVIKEVHHHHDYWRGYPYWWNGYYYGSCTTQGAGGTLILNGGTAGATNTASNMSFTCSNAGQSFAAGGEIKGGTIRATSLNACSAAPQAEVVQACADINPFDAGSTFGEKIESKVTSVAFVTDYCLGEVSVFYTFRAGLLALGIDLTKSAKVAFPAAFSGKYAVPPKGWVG